MRNNSGTPTAANSVPFKGYCLLFVSLLSIFCVFASGHTYSIDEITVLDVSYRMLKHGDISSAEPMDGVCYKGANGRYYSKYGVIHPALLLPFTLAGDIAARLTRIDPPEYLVQFTGSFSNSVTTAATCALLAAFCAALGLRHRTAFAAAYIYAFSTMAFPYAKFTFTEPVAGLVLLLTLYNLFMYEKNSNPRNILYAGLLLGVIPPLKISSSIAIPFMLCAATWLACNKKKPAHSLLAFVPAALGVIAYLALNKYIFGSAGKTGYDGEMQSSFVTPMAEGVYGMLLSGGKGMFFYSPPLALSFAGFAAYWRRWPAGAALCAALTVAYIVFFSRWLSWGGAHAWGPRHVMTVLPLLAIAAAFFIDTAGRSRPLRLTALAALVAAGIFVQAIPVSFKYFVAYENGDYESARISYNIKHGRLLTPGVPKFVPQAATAKHALRMYGRWPRHIPNILKGGGSFRDLNANSFISNKAVEESPDFWHSLLLYWRIPALTMFTLAAILAMILCAALTGRAALRYFTCVDDGAGG